MDTKQVAETLVALCREGKFDEATSQFYGNDIVSIEAREGGETQGIEAIHAKTAYWNSTFEVLSCSVDGPYINGNQFSAVFELKTKSKEDGELVDMKEIAVYTVDAGKIVREVFFY